MHYTSSPRPLSGLGFARVSAQIPSLWPRTSDVQKLVNGAVLAPRSMLSMGWGIERGHLGDEGGFYLPCFFLKLQAAAGLTRSGMADRETLELLYALDDIGIETRTHATMAAAAAAAARGGIDNLGTWVADRFRFRTALPGGGQRRFSPGPSAAMRVQASQLNQVVGRKGSAYYNWIIDVGPTSALAQQHVDKLDGRIKIIDLFNAAIYNRSSAYQQGWYISTASPELRPWSVVLALAVSDLRAMFDQPRTLKIDTGIQKWLWGHMNAGTKASPSIGKLFDLPRRISRALLGRDRDGFVMFWLAKAPAIGRQMQLSQNWSNWPGALATEPLPPWTTRAGKEERARQAKETAALADYRRQEERIKDADRKKAEADRQGRAESEAARKERLEFYTAAYKAEAELLRLQGRAFTAKLNAMVSVPLFTLGAEGGADTGAGGGHHNIGVSAGAGNAGPGGGINLANPLGIEKVPPAEDPNTPDPDAPPGSDPVVAPPAPSTEELPVDTPVSVEAPKKSSTGLLLAAGAAVVAYFAFQG